ncbi:MAG: DUF3298 domain-containing protein [Paraperlucidibaca sp.]
MLSRRQTLLFCVLALLTGLVGCERTPEPAAELDKVVPTPATAETKSEKKSVDAAPELVTNPIRFTLKDSTGCDDRCASFEVEWIEFPREAALNSLVLDQVSAPTELPTKAALSKQGQDFLRDAMEAQEPWEQIFKVSVLPGVANISVIEVVAYSYTGGAHGMTTISTINFDRATKQTLNLSDVLLPEKDAQFWHIARRVHQEWMAKQEDAQSYEGWPFVPTSMFLLTPEGLVLQYDPYAIGPYSMGTPTITISYERLRDVLKPSYLLER